MTKKDVAKRVGKALYNLARFYGTPYSGYLESAVNEAKRLKAKEKKKKQ
jgi:hypothetical protein